MKLLFGIACIACVSLTGCASSAHLNSRAIAYGPENTNVTQRLFVWGSDYSAGIGTDKGICAQGALTGRAINTKAEIETAIQQLKSVGFTQEQAVLALNASNGQTVYISSSLFYLCQIAVNRADLSKDDIVAMWQAAHTAAIAVNASAGTRTDSSVAPVSRQQAQGQSGTATTATTATSTVVPPALPTPSPTSK